jgi:hypothetical protein
MRAIVEQYFEKSPTDVGHRLGYVTKTWFCKYENTGRKKKWVKKREDLWTICGPIGFWHS